MSLRVHGSARMTTGGRKPRPRILTPPPHDEPNGDDIRAKHNADKDRRYSPDWAPIGEDTARAESKMVPIFRTKNVSDIGSESVPDAMKHNKNSAVKVANTSMTETSSTSLKKPRPKPVTKRRKAPIAEKIVDLTSSEEDRDVGLTSNDKMYPNIPKSKILAVNEIPATSITTRSASGISKKRTLSADPVDSLLISEKAKKQRLLREKKKAGSIMEKSKMDDGLTQTALNTEHNPSAVPFVDDGMVPSRSWPLYAPKVNRRSVSINSADVSDNEFPQSLLPSKQASETNNELTYPLAGDINMGDDKDFDDNYLADDERLDDNIFVIDDKKRDDTFLDLNSYDLADPFIDDSAMVDDNGIAADEEVVESETEETLTLAKKIVKDNARSSPSELLETIKTAESMARNDKINDMRLERSREKKNLSNSSSSSAKTTFADAMKHMGLRLPSKDEGPCLQDITGVRVSSLPSVCEVTNKALQDNLLADDYDTLPPLRAGSLISWSDLEGDGQIVPSAWGEQCPNLDFSMAMKALKFSQQGRYINPSCVSPLVTVAIPIRLSTAERFHLYVGTEPAICVSPIFTVDDCLEKPSDIGLHHKYISGIFHCQEWERLCGFFCMVYHKDALNAQLYRNALSFTTKPTFQRRGQDSSTGKVHGGMFSSTPSPSKKFPGGKNKIGMALECSDMVPVYDARVKSFDFDTDLENLDTVLSRYRGQIPFGSFAVVGYTSAAYLSPKNNSWMLACNIQWVIVLGTP